MDFELVYNGVVKLSILTAHLKLFAAKILLISIDQGHCGILMIMRWYLRNKRSYLSKDP